MLSSKKSLLQLCRLVIMWIAVAKIVRAQLPDESVAPTSAAVCMAGPSLEDSNSIYVNGRQYLSDRGDVACNGYITTWNFCHYVIGYRDQPMELWPGAWRLVGDYYRLVGLNVIVIEPPGYDGEQLRCKLYDVEASDWIEVQEGDYIGFYLPENGVFVASASAESDPDRQQMQRSVYGYAGDFNASEVIEAASSVGRALLRATIDPSVEKPATDPTSDPVTEPPINSSPWPTPSSSPRSTPHPTPMAPTQVEDGPGRQNGGGGDSCSVTQIVVPLVALCVILALLVVITVLIVLLRKRRAAATALDPLPHPLGKAVDATNPTTGTSDNGSVLYEAVYSQAYLQVRQNNVKSEAGYSMKSNPAYTRSRDSMMRMSSADTSTLSSPPVSNPAYLTSQRSSVASLGRYPPVIFSNRRTSTLSSPMSPPPTTPAPNCPAPPPPPVPYAHSQFTRPPTLSLGALQEEGVLQEEGPLSPPLQSPPSPYSNPYKIPRPRTPSSTTYESPLLPHQSVSASSTMTRTSQSSGDTGSTCASSPDTTSNT